MGSLTLAGTQLKPSNQKMYLHVVEGRFGEENSFAVYRGADWVIPRIKGQIRRNRVFDHLPIVLEGWVQGIGATIDLRRTDFRTTLGTLGGLFVPNHAVMNLVDTLEDGVTTKTAAVYFESAQWGALDPSGYFRRVVVNLICYNNPSWT